jgi:signal peptidase I
MASPFRPAPRERTALRDNLAYIAALILVVLLLRQVVVEAFRIEHGSMAPTLLGTHQEIRCPNCGWVFNVGQDKAGSEGAVECPNCGYHWDGASRYDSLGQPIVFRQPEWLWNSARPRDGTALETTDAANRVIRGASRIFVNKFVYSLRKPRRWEVVVFLYPWFSVRCKACNWEGEVETLEGFKCPECGSSDFEVLPPKNFIKRVVGLPNETVSLKDGDVYINGVLARKPRDVQEGLWFHVFDSGFTPRKEVMPTWDLGDMPGRWIRGAGQAPLTVDAQGAGKPVMAAFGHRIVDFYSYDGLSFESSPRSIGAAGRHEVGDCRIRAQVRLFSPDAGGGAAILEIEDAGHRFAFSVGTGERGIATLEDDGLLLGRVGVPGLVPRQPQWLALENYDHRVVCKVGDREVLSYEYESTPGGRRAVRFGARGATVQWQRIAIDRDIYYEDVPNSLGMPAVYKLGGSDYFVLGDNSPASSDSRRWKKPGVPEANMIGKAFFVFWPVQQLRWLWTGGGPFTAPASP